jgi:hypothetical protein
MMATGFFVASESPVAKLAKVSRLWGPFFSKVFCLPGQVWRWKMYLDVIVPIGPPTPPVGEATVKVRSDRGAFPGSEWISGPDGAQARHLGHGEK